MFRKYAERIGWAPENGDNFDVATSESESVKLLSAAAKEHGIWLIGGAYLASSCGRGGADEPVRAGSIPELSADDKVYNSSPIFSPDGKVRRPESFFDKLMG